MNKESFSIATDLAAMASQTPIVRQISWPAVLPQLIALASAAAIGFALAGDIGISYGALAYLAYSIGSRQILCRAHRTGIALVKQGSFAEAIPEFQDSLEFFERHVWIDRYRSIVLMSASAPSYREMALANIGFCYSQIGDGRQSRIYYKKCLEKFPTSGLAAAALRMLDSAAPRTLLALLVWKASDPRPNPLEALVGDLTTYQVHFATSHAETDADLKDHLAQVVEKAVSFAPANIRDGVTRLLFNFDVVYAHLTVVYTDETMSRDAHHVTKCEFPEIEERLRRLVPNYLDVWLAEQRAVSQRLQTWLEEILASSPWDAIPATMGLYYSEHDRGSYSPGELPAYRLSRPLSA